VGIFHRGAAVILGVSLNPTEKKEVSGEEDRRRLG